MVATLIGERTQTARIEHDCDGCGHRILPGQDYIRQVWETPWGVATSKFHIGLDRTWATCAGCSDCQLGSMEPVDQPVGKDWT